MQRIIQIIDEHIQKIDSYIPFYISNTIMRNLGERYQMVLDVGCGWGAPMKNRSLKCNYTVGIDIFLPYLKQAKLNKTHNEYVLCDAKRLPFKYKSFDTVLCFEVIEHLEKVDGIKLIDKLEEVSRFRVIITTPVGFWPDKGRDNNPNQVHRSGFYPTEFEYWGYNVRAFGFNKINLISINHIYINRFIRRILRVIFSPFSYYFPKIGERMICVKKMDNSPPKFGENI